MRSEPLNSKEGDILRRVVFVQPTTEQGLHDWIELFLDLDLPNCKVDALSNSNPMQMVFDVYNKARLNNDPDFHRALFYASRDSFKTLGSAILEVLMIVLLRRDVAHIAAILDQSRKAKQYVKAFFGKPILKDYVTGMSERHLEFTHPDGGKNLLEIMVMTMQGTNYAHPSYLSLDELDVVRNFDAYTELAFVASPRDGLLPITLLTSSRKWAWGPVQQEIDNAPNTGLQVFHWNILDVTQKCPETRCLSDQPKIPIFRSNITLKALEEKDYLALNPEEQKSFIRDEGHPGCMQNCKLFAVCQGRLATHQTSTSSLLKPIIHVQNLLRSSSLEKIKAQLMCWKPSSTGLVYTTLDHGVHCKSAAEIAEMIDGIPRPKEFGKADLTMFIAQKVQEGALSLHAGIDWGYTHNYVFALAVKDGQGRLFVIDVLAMPELELEQTIRMTKDIVDRYGGPSALLTYPDNAYPAYIKSFRKNGFRCKDFKKDVQGGIEAVRFGLMDSSGETRLFFLKGDDGVEFLWLRLGQYHWMMDASGKSTDEPDDDQDDEADAMRYLCQNIFTQGKRIAISTHLNPKQQFQNQLPIGTGIASHENYLSNLIRDRLAERGGAPGPSKGQKGSLVWDMGGGEEEVATPQSIVDLLTKKGPNQS